MPTAAGQTYSQTGSLRSEEGLSSASYYDWPEEFHIEIEQAVQLEGFSFYSSTRLLPQSTIFIQNHYSFDLVSFYSLSWFYFSNLLVSVTEPCSGTPLTNFNYFEFPRERLGVSSLNLRKPIVSYKYSHIFLALNVNSFFIGKK